MGESPFRHILVERADGIGWLRYHRPPVNAVDWDMLRELPRALESLIAAPDTRVIVVASALDRYFSSGADLGSFGLRSQQLLDKFQAVGGDVTQEFQSQVHILVWYPTDEVIPQCLAQAGRLFLNRITDRFGQFDCDEDAH